MSDLSRRWKKHANPRKWREIHEGWVGNKVVKINPESEIKHSWDIEGMY